jgi:hypothetical protein
MENVGRELAGSDFEFCLRFEYFIGCLTGVFYRSNSMEYVNCS